jgi:hypothetical protein
MGDWEQRLLGLAYTGAADGGQASMGTRSLTVSS